ncbi:LAETG motif-containing sortase-dependent surface protein [Streptomyces kebangsaanensis]|uniref:LAETG motif-containing sortase-dependent surface protein n=1 Tax=Streptomyces kebangsaanensis TaxID=864058 RepID=UPI000AE0BFD6|nr:LAETG motif-containing sortase-dependent surface protein [Streptomyces kebangsaanensis]
MKIRRSLALAAATAAITPAVLLAAPIAYAHEKPSSPTTESTAGGDAKATEDESGSTEDQQTPTDDQSSPSDDQSASETEDTKAGEDGSEASPTPSPSTTATPSPSASASASPSPGPQECKDGEKPKLDKNLSTSLSGLPSKIVAGSGFHNFKLNVKNSGNQAYKRVDMGVFAFQIDEEDFFAGTDYLTLQFKDPSTGEWKNVSLDEEDETAGYLAYTDIRAKESFSLDLRLSVDKKAPAGLGVALTIGMYADDKGNCVYAADDDFYEFDILKAGSSAGTPGDAKPQGGKKPLPAKPVGDTQIVPQGRLAETGSSSALPTIAMAGGAAVAVGVGAMFVVRRRKAGNGATA